MIKKITWFICTILTLAFVPERNCLAQDIHFSQYYASPLSLNPAYTGDYKGDWRLMNSYRHQWRSTFNTPYTTNAFGYDRQFYLFNENLSGGLIWVQDKSGDAMLKVTKI